MGHPTYTRDAADEKKVVISDSGWEAPQLGKALLEDPAGRIPIMRTKVEKDDPNKKSPIQLGDETAFKSELPKLFDHIKERLTLGLSEAWVGKSYYDYRPDEGKDVPVGDPLDVTNFMSTPEEKWARAFCEKFVFTMYAGTAQTYGYSQTKEEEIFKLFDKGIVPIVVACQHLVSWGILTRGVSLANLTSDYGAGCGCTAGTVTLKAFEKSKNKIKPMKTPTSVPVDPKAKGEDAKKQNEAVQNDLKEKGLRRENLAAPGWGSVSELLKAGITPGSAVVWNAGGSAYNSQNVIFPGGNPVAAHIALVLRISGQRIQFIDTGVVVGTGEGGTSDHGFLTGTLVSAESIVAMGVLKDTKDLMEDAAKKTYLARCLGLIRLVVVRTGSGEVAFVSKLLHMKWPLSQLIWSLRNMPTSGLTVAWLVYLPGDKQDDSDKIKAATNKLIADGSTAPAALLSPDLTLRLTNVLVSTGERVVAYRTREFKTWRKDLDNSAIENKDNTPNWAPDEAGTWLIEKGDKLRVLEWCADGKNMGQRLIRPKPGDKATIDGGSTGHPLVDP